MKQLLHFFIIALISSYSVSQNLKSPSEFLGYKIGTQFSRHSQVVDYFDHVATEMNKNISLVNYGKTYERRPLFYAIISSGTPKIQEVYIISFISIFVFLI